MTTTKPALPEPLSCPFCGHTGPLHFSDGSTFRWLSYSCSGCGMGRETRVQTLGEGSPEQWRAQAEVDAVKEWNTRAAIDAAVAEARAGLERECDDTDKLLRGLGLDPERCRTEGGALNVGKTLALLAEARAVPVAHVEETPAGPKLYVNGVCVRWELGCVHDVAFHELARRINSTNVIAKYERLNGITPAQGEQP